MTSCIVGKKIRAMGPGPLQLFPFVVLAILKAMAGGISEHMLTSWSSIIKIWFRIVICPSVIFFLDIFATITLLHKQILAMAGYYACGAFIIISPVLCSG